MAQSLSFYAFLSIVLLTHQSLAAILYDGERAIDSFIDEDTSNWIILAGDVSSALSAKWTNDAKWDSITTDLQTQKGHFITRKCANLFESTKCLCQFQRLAGTHHCHSQNVAGLSGHFNKFSLRSGNSQNIQNIQNAQISQKNSDISSAKDLVQTQLDNMLSLVNTHPNWKQLTNGDVADVNALVREEREIEGDIQAAKVEIAGDNLLDEEEILEEVQEIYEEVEDFEDEIDELEMEYNENIDDEIYDNQYAKYNNQYSAAAVDDKYSDNNEYVDYSDNLVNEDLEEELSELENMEDALQGQLDMVEEEEIEEEEFENGFEEGYEAALEEIENLDAEYDDGYVGDLGYDRYDNGYGNDYEDDHAVIDLLDEEVDTQEELIERQDQLINLLQRDNAMKEEIIEELDSDYVDNGYEYVDAAQYEAELDAMSNGIDMGMMGGYEEQYEDDQDMNIYEEREELKEMLEEDLSAAAVGYNGYDDDNAGDAALAEYDAQQYYDEGVDAKAQALVQDYDAYYDVDGQNGESAEEEMFLDAYEGDSETLMDQKEADAMIADAFWGLEVYSVAFGVLCCLCIVCVCHRWEWCGMSQAAKSEKSFGYTPYNGFNGPHMSGQNGHGGFKRVFGDDNVDNDQDPEMGRSINDHDSEEEERLYSK